MTIKCDKVIATKPVGVLDDHTSGKITGIFWCDDNRRNDTLYNKLKYFTQRKKYRDNGLNWANVTCLLLKC